MSDFFDIDLEVEARFKVGDEVTVVSQDYIFQNPENSPIGEIFAIVKIDGDSLYPFKLSNGKCFKESQIRPVKPMVNDFDIDL